MQTTRLHVFQQELYEVWRRYSDFDWLHKQLMKAHPTLIIPVKQYYIIMLEFTISRIDEATIYISMFKCDRICKKGLIMHPILQL